MKNQEKIQWVQAKMKDFDIAAYIVPTADYHQSEYLGEYFKTRAFLSGFTGSAGTLVVLSEKAYLWTDGRYYVQAEKQLEGSGIQLMKQGSPGVPDYIEFLQERLSEKANIGMDMKVFVTEDILKLQNRFLCHDVGDLTKEIWKDRASLAQDKIFIHEEKYHGEASIHKIEKIREDLLQQGLDYQLIATLDDIAWIFNLRGNDIEDNPVFLSFALISQDKVILYCDKEKMSEEIEHYLEEMGATWKEYFSIFEDLSKLKGNIGMEFATTSYALYAAAKDGSAIVVNHQPKSSFLKTIKTEVELENTKKIHILDGVAVTKFMYWLKHNYSSGEITEYSAEQYLNHLRAGIEHFQELSFHTIAGFGANAAMMHYQASQEKPVVLREGSLFLVDSGGQYLEGTTDITRTFALGEVPEEQKKHFTLTLKGMIDLSKAKFMHGATGTNLDILARQHLWNIGIDYKCGTGHGVGHFLGVHDGLHGIRFQYNVQRLEENMVVTNEPGVYIAGSHGIRIENELFIKAYLETEHGKFLQFETLTFVPIDLDAILPELLSPEEKEWLNHYHKEVFTKISPFLKEEEKEWLKIYTRSI